MPNDPLSMNAPLAGCTTIDATTPDGYLDNARHGNPGAGANENTQQAAQNLLGCATPKPPPAANIVGHGAEGDIDTGQAWNQCITLDNIDEWTPDLAVLATKISHLFLFGCTVGAGADGAQLLFEIAKAVNAPVSAPTGLIYCDINGDFTLEPGAVWQQATPTYTPAPIDPPAHTQSTTQTNAGSASPVTKVASAQYVSKGTGIPAPDDRALAMAKEIIWTPISTPGEHGAKHSGTITVETYTENQSETKTRTMVVYNHVLLEDMDTRENFYATPMFKTLANLR